MATSDQPDGWIQEGEITKNELIGEAGQLDAYNIIKSFGQCFDSGIVLLATKKSSQKSGCSFLAVRKYNLEDCRKEICRFLKEIWLMKNLNHENLLACIDSFVIRHSLCIVTPLVDYGSALDLIQTHFINGFPEIVIAGILRDVLQALVYLHSKGYIHRSVKASHILISSKGQVLLTGLRDAYCLVEKGRWQTAVFDYPIDAEQNFCWLSPEVLQQNLRGYCEKSDIYSLGITACELANGIAPFVDLPSTQLLINKLNGPPPQIWDCTTVPTPEHRIILPNQPADSGVFDGVTACSNIDARLEAAYQRTFSRSFHRFTMLCVQLDPGLRPGSTQLLKHPFIQSIRKGSIANWLECLTCIPTIGKNAELESAAYSIPDDEEDQHFSEDSMTWDFYD
ncbi:STE20-related kinase adapter protein alpha isoform X2 [Daphnia magna]|nr:STE20-related kinase adapter protein alpha isoform X2 [Daphnia magna]KAK4008801.1 hypothetical protein OUZ56_013928 [Daphnia magna]KZS03932.1 putative Serine/threonine-protein kinase STE20 [Daphnia magna]